MPGKTFSTSQTLGTAPADRLQTSNSILAVGEPGEWRKQGNALPNGAISFAAFTDVTSEMLEHLRPTTICSPVLANSFDCIELATLLQNLGFTGSYRAYAKSLPKPELIEREVRQICRRLDFRIFLSDN